MISRFCIDRPIFAMVISIVIVLVGTISVFLLPVEQYPDITPWFLNEFFKIEDILAAADPAKDNFKRGLATLLNH